MKEKLGPEGEIVSQYLQAVSDGDLESVKALLDPGVTLAGPPVGVEWAYAIFREGLDKERDVTRTQLIWGGFTRTPAVPVPLPAHATTSLILRVRVRGQRNTTPPPPPPGTEKLFDWVDYEITYQ